MIAPEMYREVIEVPLPEPNLIDVSLGWNQISDISSLVDNTGLGQGDGVDLRNNNLDLSEGSEDLGNIRQLEERGVVVER